MTDEQKKEETSDDHRTPSTVHSPPVSHATVEPLSTRNAPTQTRDLTTRSFQLRADSVNEEERSVEAVMVTEDPVTVYDWRSGQLVDEILRMDGAELPDQLPLLETHNRWSIASLYGSVRQIRIEDAQAIGRLFFAEGDPDVERTWQKVRQRHLRDVSIGYQVTESRTIQPGETQVIAGTSYTAQRRPLRVATRWAGKELSVVPIGADPRSKIRGHQPEESFAMNKKLRAYLESIGLRAEATEQEAREYCDQLQGDQRQRADALKEDDGQRSNPPPPGDAPPATPPAEGQRSESQPSDPPADPAAVAQRAVAAERDRVHQVTELAGDDVPAEIRQRAIHEGWDLARASREFLAGVRDARRPENGVPDGAPAGHSRSREADSNVRSLAAGVLIGQGLDPTENSLYRGRGVPRPSDRLTEEDADRGSSFQSISAVDLFRECVRLDTGRFHLSIEECFEAARAAPSGGMLSYVFSTNVYARLLEGWKTVGDTTEGWVDIEDVANFQEQEDISIAANARLERLPRGDTAKHATASDSRETYKIARYAKQFVVDEQDVIDDRLGAIMRMPLEMGEAARQLRPDLVYSLMLENGTMNDTGAVFNATAVTTAGGHANLGTGALASATLKAAISAMVKQRLNRTSSDPGRQLTIRPKFLIVPADLEWTARELTAAAALAKLFADSSDPYYAQLNLLAKEGLRVVPDDRIGAIGVLDPESGAARTGLDTNWFLAAGGLRGLRVAYRRGTNRQPQMRSFNLDKGQWGRGWDIYLDIGAAFTEYRTWYKSTGAA